MRETGRRETLETWAEPTKGRARSEANRNGKYIVLPTPWSGRAQMQAEFATQGTGEPETVELIAAPDSAERLSSLLRERPAFQTDLEPKSRNL